MNGYTRRASACLRAITGQTTGAALYLSSRHACEVKATAAEVLTDKGDMRAVKLLVFVLSGGETRECAS